MLLFYYNYRFYILLLETYSTSLYKLYIYFNRILCKLLYQFYWFLGFTFCILFCFVVHVSYWVNVPYWLFRLFIDFIISYTLIFVLVLILLYFILDLLFLVGQFLAFQLVMLYYCCVIHFVCIFLNLCKPKGALNIGTLYIVLVLLFETNYVIYANYYIFIVEFWLSLILIRAI